MKRIFKKYLPLVIGCIFITEVAAIDQSNNSLVGIDRGIKVYPVQIEMSSIESLSNLAPKTGRELMLTSFETIESHETEWSGPSAGLVRRFYHKSQDIGRKNYRFKFHSGRVQLSDAGPSLEKMKIFAHKDLVEGVFNHAEIMFGREFVPSQKVDAMDACGELLFEDHDPQRGGEFYLKLGFGKEIRRQKWKEFNECKLSVVSSEERTRLLKMVAMVPSMLSMLKCSGLSMDRNSYPEDFVVWLVGSANGECPSQ